MPPPTVWLAICVARLHQLRLDKAFLLPLLLPLLRLPSPCCLLVSSSWLSNWRPNPMRIRPSKNTKPKWGAALPLGWKPPLRSCEAATPRRKTGHLDMAATAVAKVRQRSAAVTLNTATGAAAVSGVAQATGGACAPPFGDGMSCFCHVTATSRAHATPPNLRAARPISSQAIRGACARPCRSRRICVRRCVCWVFGDVHASRSHVSDWDPAPQIGTCLRFAPPPSLPAAVAAARRCRSPRGCSAHCAPRRERRAARARRYDALTWR